MQNDKIAVRIPLIEVQAVSGSFNERFLVKKYGIDPDRAWLAQFDMATCEYIVSGFKYEENENRAL